MKRTYVLNSKVMYTPGEDRVDILVQCVTLDALGNHVNELQESVAASQTALSAAGSGTWGDSEIHAAAQDKLAARYPTDEIEVIGLDEWNARWQAELVRRAEEKKAALADAASAVARAAAL